MAFRLTKAPTAWPGVKVPLVGDTVSQGDVLAQIQFKLEPLLLVSKIVREELAKGPPIKPEADNPLAGETPRASRASASIKGWPAGVPHPVQRSKPGTAKKLLGLPDQVLLPSTVSWKQDA